MKVGALKSIRGQLKWETRLSDQIVAEKKVLSVGLSIFLYVLTSEGDIRRVPRNQVLGVSFC